MPSVVAIAVVVGTVGGGAAGAAALAIGLIGRRLDDHPTCRACGFDLIGKGSTPGAVLGAPCPECGRPIATEKDVRVGTRTRRRGALAAGMCLLTLALLIAIPFVVVPLAGQTASKPTWLLLVEAEYGTTKLQETAADELMNRHVAGTLPAADGLRLVTLAAAVHANQNAAFTKVWREIMHDLALFAMLPQASRDAAAVVGVEPFLKWREKVRSGAGVPLAIGIALKGDERVLGAQERTLALKRIVWRVTRVSGEVVASGAIERERLQLSLIDTPSSTTWMTQNPEVDLKPGTYVLVVDLDACVVPQSFMMGPAKGIKLDGPAVTMSKSGRFGVLDEEKPSVDVVQDARLFEKVRSSVRIGPKHVIVQPRMGPGHIKIRYDVVDQGPGGEHDGLCTTWHAELWLADGSARVEGLTQTTAAWVPLNGSMQGGAIWLEAANRVEPGKFRLRLRADTSAAEKTEYVYKILGGEMEFEVELEESPKATP